MGIKLNTRTGGRRHGELKGQKKGREMWMKKQSKRKNSTGGKISQLSSTEASIQKSLLGPRYPNELYNPGPHSSFTAFQQAYKIWKGPK